MHLQIDASALRDPAPCSRSLPRPSPSEVARGLHPGRKQSCLWWLVPRPRLFSHVRPLFVVRGSRQAKFADEVRINETHIKTGRTALMARLNKVPSIRPDLRRDPSQLVFVTHWLTISHLLHEANSFYRNPPPDFAMSSLSADQIEARFSTISGLAGGELHVASRLVPDAVVGARSVRSSL